MSFAKCLLNKILQSYTVNMVTEYNNLAISDFNKACPVIIVLLKKVR
uniref:Uncharacterized protein n=1 Tax=Anguilla anguilla TaxID=7936 RepID=A0A0E9Q1U6_ANGAN